MNVLQNMWGQYSNPLLHSPGMLQHIKFMQIVTFQGIIGHENIQRLPETPPSFYKHHKAFHISGCDTCVKINQTAKRRNLNDSL